MTVAPANRIDQIDQIDANEEDVVLTWRKSRGAQLPPTTQSTQPRDLAVVEQTGLTTQYPA